MLLGSMNVTLDKDKMILGITGHRPNKLGGYNNKTNRSAAIKANLFVFFKSQKPEWLVSGMALGVDQWAVEVALELGIKVKAFIPCAGQEKLWPAKAQEEYHELLAQIVLAGGNVIQLSNDPYRKELMHARNGSIVEVADTMLAVWDGSPGGTGNCVWQAKKAGRIIYQLHPHTLEIKEYV